MIRWTLTSLFAELNYPVFLMHEQSRHSPRPAIYILVMTPNGKIDIPIMQLQLNVSNGMRTVPADWYPL